MEKNSPISVTKTLDFTSVGTIVEYKLSKENK